jgi:hypothetical protein
MFPNNHEIMYRYARLHNKEIQDDVESARGGRVRAHILRRRLAVVAVVGLTLIVMTLALGWWVI